MPWKPSRGSPRTIPLLVIRISRMVFYLVNEIANAAERPRWDPKGLQEVRGMTR